jgi:multiple sugar transport system substrate-binding protein
MAILKERGFDRPPKSFEELIEYAEKLTFTRPDGSQVNGFVLGGPGSANIIDIVRAHGGEFLDENFKLHASEPGMVAAVQLLVDFYKKGILPKNYPSFQTEDATTFMQQGRAAMTINPFDRHEVFNDPAKSKNPGQIMVTTTPVFEKTRDKIPAVAAKTEVWAISIPKNAKDKELSWSFVKHLSTLDAAVRGALNGNGPARNAAYEDPRVQARISYWQASAEAIKTARVPLPGFKNSAKVDDISIEEVQAALVGSKTVQQAMNDLVRRVQPLLPT